MSFLKSAWIILLAWCAVMLITVMAADAYWYERMGSCDGCMVLESYFKWREL